MTGDGRGDGSLLDLTVRELLDAIAGRSPAPGAGAVGAVAAALAAALTAMAARFSDDDPAAAAADGLRDRVARLADADGVAYREFLAAVRLPREPDPRAREDAIARAREGTCAVPVEIGELAAEVAGLAAGLAADGNRNLHGDAVTAGLLAAAAAAVAAELVAANLGADSTDPRLRRARELAAATARTAPPGEA